MGDWNGVNTGHRDFVACKLDANGHEVWRWQVNLSHQNRAKLVFHESGSLEVCSMGNVGVSCFV